MKKATIFDEHCSVLSHWFETGVRAATVVCLDAHLDLQFIDEARIALLRECSTAEELAELASLHPLATDRSRCYGIEDFMYAAGRLGILRRLIWVAPPQELAAGVTAALGGLQQMEGVSIDDLESFRVTPGGWLEGHLLGLEIAICELPQLRLIAIDGDVMVDIDTDYLVTVPDDLVWAKPQHVIAELAARFGGNDRGLTIARSVGSGFVPLRHRFLADYLRSLWDGDEEDSVHWQGLLDMDEHFAAGRREVALAGLKLLHPKRPGCAASCYALALATSDPQERELYRAEAAILERSYRNDIIRLLSEFPARRKAIDLAAVVNLRREVERMEGGGDHKALAWVALGSIYAAFGRAEAAAQCDEQSRRYGSGHPDLALQIARLRIARGETSEAVPLLDRAVNDDETRVLARLLLAECARRMGNSREAISHAESARLAAPAWSLVLKRLAAFSVDLGDGISARRWLTECARLESRIAAVMTSLTQ